MKNKLLSLLVLVATSVLLSASCIQVCFSQSEQITITTYYPSPYGVYKQLLTQSFGVGDNNNSGSLDSGDVPSNSGDMWVAGNIGVGTNNPAARLDVNGGIKIGDTNVCNGTTEGTVRYNSATKAIEYCDGANWRRMGGLQWGNVCRARMRINNNASLCCAADEYLVDVWVADEGSDGDVVPGSYGSITRGYGGCVATTGSGGNGVHAFGILCCKDQQ